MRQHTSNLRTKPMVDAATVGIAPEDLAAAILVLQQMRANLDGQDKD